MQNCPKCGSPVDGAWCGTCGEGKPATELAVTVDPDHFLCCNVTSQGRCSRPGAFGDTTQGFKPGHERWYCYQHFPPFYTHHGERTAPPATWRQSAPKQHAIPIDQLAEDMLERAAIQAEGA